MQFNPEKIDDKWFQAALTVEGKVGNFDVTYAGAYMKRQIDRRNRLFRLQLFLRRALTGYGAYWYDNDGKLIDPTQYIDADDSFKKQSHELRFTSPADKRLRLVAGLFYQRQTAQHRTELHHRRHRRRDLRFRAPDNIWLTKQLRVDRDYAAFGELSFDITPKLTAHRAAAASTSTTTRSGRLLRLHHEASVQQHRQSLIASARPSRRLALHQRRQAHQGQRLRPSPQPDVQAERRLAVLRDLVARLPARRRQPPRQLPALQAGLPHQL